MSAVCTIKVARSGSPSATRGEAESLRCETVQVEGRHPCLVTGAAVLGVLLTPTSRELKVSEAGTSAGTFQVCYADEVHTCDYFGCAVRLLYAGPRTVGASHSEHLL